MAAYSLNSWSGGNGRVLQHRSWPFGVGSAELHSTEPTPVLQSGIDALVMHPCGTGGHDLGVLRTRRLGDWGFESWHAGGSASPSDAKPWA